MAYNNLRTYKGPIKELPENGIFVFGSNTQGRHGKGAAKTALTKFGAIYGQSNGLQGRSYAIVTKDLTKQKHPSIPEGYIVYQIGLLYRHAFHYAGHDFYIAYNGTGTNLNGYTPHQMASMFAQARGTHSIMENIIFEEEFAKLVSDCIRDCTCDIYEQRYCPMHSEGPDC